MNDKERPYLDGLLSWAKELADPDWCLSVPAVAKTALIQLVTVIENAKPRTITTVEELDALPMGSKVVSAGYEWTKNYATTNTPSGGIEREVWFNVYDDFDMSEDLALPAVVLHEPAQ
jgi:hypothetical protein